MRFYDRQDELKALNEVVKWKGASMVVIGGRRRVGKSRLVDEFMKEHAGLKWIVVPKEEKQAAADLSAILADDYKPNFATVREALEYFLAKSKARILYLDEFPNVLDVNPAIPYEMQGLWEAYGKKTDKILIFSGSYVRMMDRIFTKKKAPLFNRATSTLLIAPLSPKFIWQIHDDLGRPDPAEKIRDYCVLGGIPFYYELLERHPKNAPLTALFFGLGPLKEEGQNILRQEFGDAYRKYFSILEAIGAGLSSSTEIANRLGMRPTTLSKYLQALQDDFKLVERNVPYGQNPSRSKKGLYSIHDNLLAFWFKHVNGRSAPPAAQEVEEFVSLRFEGLCVQALSAHLEKQGETIVHTGKWWGAVRLEEKKNEQRDIDVVVETKTRLYVGECKWTNHRIGESELKHLQESARAIPSSKPIIWVLFSKSGFSLKEREDLMLFDAGRIVKME